MSFKSIACNVRDAERPIGSRMLCLKSYLSELAYSTRMHYHELYRWYMPTKKTNTTEAEILVSLQALEGLREQYRVLRVEAIQAREVERMQRPIRPRKGDLRAVGDIELPTDGGKSS